MRHQRRWLRLSALLMGLAIFAAACGGDDDDSSGDDTSDTTEGESATAAPPIGEAEPSCTGDSDGMVFVGELANGQKITGSISNNLGSGFSPVDGYGVINAQEAVFGAR